MKKKLSRGDAVFSWHLKKQQSQGRERQERNQREKEGIELSNISKFME
jgi:hypothetical protein